MMDNPFTTEAQRHRGNPVFGFARLVFLCVLCVSVVNPVFAKEAAPLAADPVVEKRLLAITAELRCLVCQNQTIADSNADLANDFRREIRKLIAEGKSDQEILDFMVARYGDFVLYRPPLKATTVILWAGPLVLMVLGLIALIRYLRQRNRRLAADAPLSADEARQAEALLKETTKQ